MVRSILEPKLKKELKSLAPELDEKEFVRGAVEEKILALKRERFSKMARELRSRLEKRGYSVEEILEEFNKTT